MDLVDFRLNQLETKIDLLVKLVVQLTNDDSMHIVDASEYAKILGIKRDTLYKKKWLMPNFGRNEGKNEWTKAEVREWLAKGTDEIYREYLELCKKEMAHS